jgi:hypothetical protein
VLPSEPRPPQMTLTSPKVKDTRLALVTVISEMATRCWDGKTRKTSMTARMPSGAGWSPVPLTMARPAGA